MNLFLVMEIFDDIDNKLDFGSESFTLKPVSIVHIHERMKIGCWLWYNLDFSGVNKYCIVNLSSSGENRVDTWFFSMWLSFKAVAAVTGKNKTAKK